MDNFIKVMVFNFVLLVSYAGFSNFAIPKIIPEAPPKEAVISGDMTMDDFIALGSKIFLGKGTCTLCHKKVGGRAPLLNVPGGVGARAPKRIKEDRYKGKATSGEGYIRESMMEPSAYVVKGFGKRGTNDTVSPMPVINKGSIGLNDAEITAVISYLQSISGVEVTTSVPSGDVPIAEEEAPAIASAATAEEAITKHGCGTCHLVLAEEGEVGPPLKNVGSIAGTRVEGLSAEDYIRQSIMTPNAFIVPDFEPDMMPPDFIEKMTVKELEMIIAFLVESK